MDNQFDDLPPDERLKQRQLVLKPKVDDFFAWVRTSLPKVPAGGATAKALNYCLNQESYLRVLERYAQDIFILIFCQGAHKCSSLLAKDEHNCFT